MVDVTVNGVSVFKTKLDPSMSFIEVPDFASKLVPETPTVVKINVNGSDAPVPYSFVVEFASPKPDNHPLCVVQMTAKLGNTRLSEGEGSEIAVGITNLDKKEGIPMVIARIGLPGGLEPRHAQLQELVRSNTITYYEVRSREVDIYLQQMVPGQTLNIKIDVVARVPGTYTGAASSVYLYYTPEQKYWISPLECNIKPSA